jgi:YesN/AraC family two-component response regulator
LQIFFQSHRATTIEHFLIAHKIERVKELLVYNELNISEIAWKLGYSSVAHLSNQFKKMTGLTPSFFKKIKDKKLGNLEDL